MDYGEIYTEHFPDRDTMMKILGFLKHDVYQNVLHIHEVPKDNQAIAGLHTIGQCEAHNAKRLDLSNPNLFDCTYDEDGTIYRAWGWVAFQEPKPELQPPTSFGRAKTTKYRNPELEKSHRLHEELDRQLWDRIAGD
jgi:hypothetical protein